MFGTQEVFGFEIAMILTTTMEELGMNGKEIVRRFPEVRIYPGGDPDLFFTELDEQGVVIQGGYRRRDPIIRSAMITREGG